MCTHTWKRWLCMIDEQDEHSHFPVIQVVSKPQLDLIRAATPFSRRGRAATTRCSHHRTSPPPSLHGRRVNNVRVVLSSRKKKPRIETDTGFPYLGNLLERYRPYVHVQTGIRRTPSIPVAHVLCENRVTEVSVSTELPQRTRQRNKANTSMWTWHVHLQERGSIPILVPTSNWRELITSYLVVGLHNRKVRGAKSGGYGWVVREN